MKALLAGKLVEISGGEGVEVIIENDGEDIRIKGAPSALYQGSAKNDGTLILRAPIVLKAPSLGVSQESVTLTVDGPGASDYDFDPPRLTFSLGTPQGTRVALRVEVSDDHPRETAPSLTVGNKRVALNKDGNAYVARLSLGEGILAPAPGADKVLLEAEDLFGNRAVLADDSWASAMARARTELLRGSLDTVLSKFSQETSNSRFVISADKLRRSTSAVRNAVSELKSLSKFGQDATKERAARLWDDALNLASSWSAAGKEPSFLSGLRADYDRFFAAANQLTAMAGATKSNDRQNTLWQQILSQAKTAASANNSSDPKPNVGPNYGQYNKSESIEALGIRFYRVEIGKKPTWIAEVEVSQGFASEFDSSLIKVAGDIAKEKFDPAKPHKRSNSPLAPLSPKMAVGLVRKINRSAAGQALSNLFGGPVKVDIPTEKAWYAAAMLQTNGKKGFAFGPNFKPEYKYSKFQNPRARWYDGLRGIGTEDKGKFDFLSGNVAEIVRVKRGYGLKGGSMANACFGDQLFRLKVETPAEPLRPGAVTRCSGLRLAIVPK